MKKFNYNLNTTQQTSTATVSTITQNLTGTTTVTFSLSDIDQTQSPVDKVIITFYDDRELVFNRSLDPSIDTKSLSSTTFTQIIHSELIDSCEKPVDILLHRDDGITDFYTIQFKMFKSLLSDYTDVNLIKTDFIDTEDSQDNLLLTFAADDPGIVGTSILSSNIDDYFYFGSNTTATSSCSTQVGFIDEYDFVQAALSFSTFNISAAGCLDSKFKFKYRTRVGVGTSVINFPGLGSFIPAIPNTQFVHVTGCIGWFPGETTRVKDISVPLIDVYGANLSTAAENYFENVTTGVGTSIMPVSGGYFYIDLYDLEGCETINIATSTLTAYITYK